MLTCATLTAAIALALTALSGDLAQADVGTIRASASCSSIGSGKVVATVKPSASGAFKARFTLPAGQATVFLRAQTRVRKHAGSRTTFPTFTLVRGVRLAS